MDAFRAGTIDKDTTVIKVNSSATWGTQANPIVLATYDDWVKFVKHCANNYNNTRNKYYVLANDIDFSGKTFYAIAMFGGTFYGNGHALKNITCSSWTVCLNGNDFISMTGSNTSSRAGVFCFLSKATVTDFSVENATFSNCPAKYLSLIVGGADSAGTVTLLNCHSSGSANIHSYVAGILGGTTSTNGVHYFYRSEERRVGKECH